MQYLHDLTSRAIILQQPTSELSSQIRKLWNQIIFLQNYEIHVQYERY